MFLLGIQRVLQRTKDCVIWIPYAKVTKFQTVFGRCFGGIHLSDENVAFVYDFRVVILGQWRLWVSLPLLGLDRVSLPFFVRIRVRRVREMGIRRWDR